MEGLDGNRDLTCENCRFFELDHTENSGYCRRYAPKPMSFADAEDSYAVDIAWPRMSLEDWCGEFQPHPITAESRKQRRDRMKEQIAEFVRQNYRKPPAE